jgi:hypothetical protein
MAQHQLKRVGKGFTCTVCGWSWTWQPPNDCPGLPIYQWGKYPPHLRTKKQLHKEGYNRRGKLPPAVGVVAAESQPGGWIYLYDVRLAVRRQPTHPGRVEAWEKARTARWARKQ